VASKSVPDDDDELSPTVAFSTSEGCIGGIETVNRSRPEMVRVSILCRCC
jgi:hypothetical protein